MLMLTIFILSLLSVVTLVLVSVFRKQFLSFSQYNPWVSKPPFQNAWISVTKTLLFWLVILPLSYLELIVEGILYTPSQKSLAKNYGARLDQPTQNDHISSLNEAQL